jgi:hypothetical protein
VTSPAPVSPPAIAIASPPPASQPEPNWSQDSSGFDEHPADSGFGGFGESSGFEQQPAQVSPFDNFGEPQPAADFHSFGDAAPTSPAGDGFAAFESDGFHSFSPAAASASDGFAAFESTSPASGKMSAFDAFDF